MLRYKGLELPIVLLEINLKKSFFRAQLDDEFLLKFPDVKEKLLGKINLCIEEEMNSILKVQ